MAPIARWSSFAADVGPQATALSSHASRLWLRAVASTCGIDDALAGIPGRGRHDSAVAQNAGGMREESDDPVGPADTLVVPRGGDGAAREGAAAAGRPPGGPGMAREDPGADPGPPTDVGRAAMATAPG